jgi:hypothetical protein
MNIAHPAADNKFTIALIPGEYRLAFDSAITKLGIESVTLDGKPVVNWKIRIDDSASPHKFAIAIEGKKP